MPSFSIPASLFARLARLFLACDGNNTSQVLTNIALRVSGNIARFIATDGKLLVVIRSGITWLESTPPVDLDLVLDAVQLTAAADAIIARRKSGQSVVVDVNRASHEVRLASAVGAHLVRLIDGSYPPIDSVLTKYSGYAWAPALATFDTKLLALVAKIIGTKRPVLLSSPVPTGSPVLAAWSSKPVTDATSSVQIADLKRAIGGPGFWADHELLVLLMPISRSDESTGIDLIGWSAATAKASAIAA